MQNDVQIPAGMKAWHGDGESMAAPDWDGGPVLFDNGCIGQPVGHQWQPFGAIIVLAYTPSTPETGEPVADEARAREVRRNPDDPEWSYCPACKTGFLDTGFECNSCGFDAQPLVALQEACEDSGDRMHPSGLYQREIDNPIRLAFRETSVAAGNFRALLIEAGRNAGAYIDDRVSDDFLKVVPQEVRLKIASLATPPAQPDGREAVADGAESERYQPHVCHCGQRFSTGAELHFHRDEICPSIAAAKIIDPDAWHDTLPADGCGEYWSIRRSKALAKADAILALTPPAPDVREMREAAQGVLDRMFSTYKARNGREVGIQGDDGEKCWIVHSDDIEALRSALARGEKA